MRRIVGGSSWLNSSSCVDFIDSYIPVLLKSVMLSPSGEYDLSMQLTDTKASANMLLRSMPHIIMSWECPGVYLVVKRGRKWNWRAWEANKIVNLLRALWEQFYSLQECNNVGFPVFTILLVKFLQILMKEAQIFHRCKTKRIYSKF